MFYSLSFVITQQCIARARSLSKADLIRTFEELDTGIWTDAASGFGPAIEAYTGWNSRFVEPEWSRSHRSDDESILDVEGVQWNWLEAFGLLFPNFETVKITPAPPNFSDPVFYPSKQECCDLKSLTRIAYNKTISSGGNFYEYYMMARKGYIIKTQILKEHDFRDHPLYKIDPTATPLLVPDRIEDVPIDINLSRRDPRYQTWQFYVDTYRAQIVKLYKHACEDLVPFDDGSCELSHDLRSAMDADVSDKVNVREPFADIVHLMNYSALKSIERSFYPYIPDEHPIFRPNDHVPVCGITGDCSSTSTTSTTISTLPVINDADSVPTSSRFDHTLTSLSLNGRGSFLPKDVLMIPLFSDNQPTWNLVTDDKFHPSWRMSTLPKKPPKRVLDLVSEDGVFNRCENIEDYQLRSESVALLETPTLLQTCKRPGFDSYRTRRAMPVKDSPGEILRLAAQWRVLWMQYLSNDSKTAATYLDRHGSPLHLDPRPVHEIMFRDALDWLQSHLRYGHDDLQCIVAGVASWWQDVITDRPNRSNSEGCASLSTLKAYLFQAYFLLNDHYQWNTDLRIARSLVPSPELIRRWMTSWVAELSENGTSTTQRRLLNKTQSSTSNLLELYVSKAIDGVSYVPWNIDRPWIEIFTRSFKSEYAGGFYTCVLILTILVSYSIILDMGNITKLYLETSQLNIQPLKSLLRRSYRSEDYLDVELISTL